MFSLFKKKYTVVVHDGSFHSDEILGCAIMSIYLKGRMRIVRTRDPHIISGADYVLDVGGVYNHDMHMYDHHQTEGAGVRDNGIPYATAGLIWKHYGRQIVKNEDLWNSIDRKLVQPIDAVDNGVDLIETKFDGVYPYGLHQIVATRRPTWREEGDINMDKEFAHLVEFFKDILKRELEIERDKMLANKEVAKAVEVSPYESIVVLHENFPFEEALRDYPNILFVVSPRLDGTWRVAGVQKEKDSFELRKPLPHAWAGLRGQALQMITGEPKARFCHRALFLAVAEDKDTALRLAKKALILE